MYLDLTSLYNRQQKRSNPLFIKIILIYNKCHTFNLYKMHLTLHAIYIHKTYLIKSVCQMYLHLAIFRHRGQFLSSDSREAETAKIRKLDRTLNIIDLIYKPEHFLSLSLSLSLCRGIFLLYCGQISAGYITSCRRLSVAGCHHHVFYGGSRRGGKPEIKVTEPEIFLSGFVSSR